jgi:hypothetical protein
MPTSRNGSISHAPSDAVRRALVGRQLVDLGFTHKEARELCRCSAGYLITLGRLSRQERKLVGAGEVSLARLHNGLSNAYVDRFIQQIGISRAWAAIERLTAPAA